MSLIPEQIDESQTELYRRRVWQLKDRSPKASEIRAKIKAGSINSNSLAWEKGLSEWKKLNDPYWEKHGFVFQNQIPKIQLPSKATIRPSIVGN